MNYSRIAKAAKESLMEVNNSEVNVLSELIVLYEQLLYRKKMGANINP